MEPDIDCSGLLDLEALEQDTGESGLLDLEEALEQDTGESGLLDLEEDAY
jgi:hypothetical protein